MAFWYALIECDVVGLCSTGSTPPGDVASERQAGITPVTMTARYGFRKSVHLCDGYETTTAGGGRTVVLMDLARLGKSQARALGTHSKLHSVVRKNHPVSSPLVHLGVGEHDVWLRATNLPAKSILVALIRVVAARPDPAVILRRNDRDSGHQADRGEKAECFCGSRCGLLRNLRSERAE